MSLKKVLVGTMVASQLVTAQMAQAFTVAVDTNFFGGFTGSSENFVGHEEITRQALVILSEIFRQSELNQNAPEYKVYSEIKKLGLLDFIQLNRHTTDIVSGATSENPIIQGNYATDMPGKAKKYPELKGLTNGRLRLENSIFAASMFKGNADYQKYMTAKFIEQKGKRVGLADLNDQQAFFIKVLFESTLMARLYDLREARKANPSQSAQLIAAEKASRATLVPQLEVLARNWGGDWHNNPDGQITHFLRNYTNVMDPKTKKVTQFGLASAKSTCNYGRSILIALIRNALSHLPQLIQSIDHPLAPVREQGKLYAKMIFFLVGHATHTLQDSFSGEHTRRALPGMARKSFNDLEPEAVNKLMARASVLVGGKPVGAKAILEAENNSDILDICFYGAEQAASLGAKANEACYHKYLAPDAATIKVMNNSTMKGDFGDSIWTYGEGRGSEGETIKYKKLGFLRTEATHQSEKLYKAREGNLLNRTQNWGGARGGLGELVDGRSPRSGKPEGQERWTMINHNARLARTATVKLLYTALKYIADESPKIRTTLRGSNAAANTAVQGILHDPKLEVMLMDNVFARGVSGKMDPSWVIDWNRFNTVTQISERDEDGKVLFTAPLKNISQVMSSGAFRCELMGD